MTNNICPYSRRWVLQAGGSIEQDRQENDTREASAVLSQTDMIKVLLECVSYLES